MRRSRAAWPWPIRQGNLLKIAVVERYTGKCRTGLGFVRGFGLRRGALASSVAHDSHNIVVVGTDDMEMTAATDAPWPAWAAALCAVRDRAVRAALPLPIAGLMSPEPMAVIRDRLDDLIAAAREMGSPLRDPFMTLSFLALPVIPN